MLTRRRLGEVLVEEGVITDRDLQSALALQKETGQRLGQALLTLGAIDEDRLAWCLGKLAGVSVLNLNNIFIDPRTLRLLPRERCLQLHVVPVGMLDGVLTVAMVDPFDVVALDQIQMLIQLPVRVVVATEAAIVKTITRHHSEEVGLDEVVSRILPPQGVELLEGWDFSSGGDDSTVHSTPEEFRREAESPPVIRLTNSIIRDAIRMRASDIHIEPMETCCAVRYRIDGLLKSIVSIPQFLHPRMVCRIKVMSRMDIAEHRLPQDGRCRARVAGNEVDLRVSSMPSQFGEKIVIRILNPKEAQVRLDGLGLLPDAHRQVEKMLRAGQGIILLTGPTGGGKTSTLYAMINRLRSEACNIVTLEDPIEISIPGVTQTQIHERAGLSFAAGFRSVLRQDPDVIMLGEVRDAETAEITFNAAITGHLVLSTLHTNDCCSVPVRLTELGVSPFLVTAAVKGIISQRLVRRLCLQCREPYEPDEATRRILGLHLRESISLYRPKGCKACGQAGYFGRVGVFEVLTLTDSMKEMIFRGDATASRLTEQAAREGVRDLMEDAALKVVQGVTSVDEVMRVIPLEERKGVCPQCQHRVERGFVTCPFCSFPLARNQCHTCGKEVDESWQFCPYCSSLPQVTASMGLDVSVLSAGDVSVGTPRRCLQCGLALRPTWETCPLCLASLAATEESTWSAAPPGSPATAPAPLAAVDLQAGEPRPISVSAVDADPGERAAVAGPEMSPAAPGPVLTPSLAESPAPLPLLLLVADDPITMLEARRVSEGAGFRMTFAADGEQAMRRLALRKPVAVLVETVLGPVDAFDACRRLSSRGTDSQIPVLMLSGESREEDAQRARDSGASALLPRPLTAEALRAAVRACTPYERTP